MIPRADMRYIALVLIFTFCQVSGTMCALPDLSLVEDAARLVEDTMVCPMDGTMMCPPSATSSPERQVKNGMVLDVPHAAVLSSPITELMTSSVETQWPRSSAFSIVLPLIVDLLVLRI